MSAQLTAQLYKQILASLKSDPPNRSTNKRAQGRVGLRCSVQITPVSFGDTGANPFVVWVRDISMKGIGIVTSMPMSENSTFVAHFSRDPEPPLAVNYKVIYCRRLSSDLYSVGAALEQPAKRASSRPSAFAAK
jgi:hypothetical protein